MTAHITLSSKGQIVIPKDIRDALGLKPGEKLAVSLRGGKIVMEPSEPVGERISFEEFRRRVPKYEGPPATIEEMNRAVDEMFANQGRP
ncbi:MAG: AbrB/MazE/SpoVT family DNA-binding domain-containing protein [Allosphingosinicella sp.]